jgi:hypothetical protein
MTLMQTLSVGIWNCGSHGGGVCVLGWNAVQLAGIPTFSEEYIAM